MESRAGGENRVQRDRGFRAGRRLVGGKAGSCGELLFQLVAGTGQ